ncbi:PREDICTED: xaa-Pro dipeptidase [Eufriesea mexicana]|uniref:xaa-Pro dipeptidase n=1 Tax=Eufriesea mexicana TaxID=516756 RepID=UPI00083BF349|nr:PREDICTED: xaa-Pro dipeptidase [Eufriesea mexicana]
MTESNMAETTHSNKVESYFQRGNSTLKVPMSLFRNNRKRLVARVKAHAKVPATGTFIILQGGVEIPFNDTDISWPFRQESFFQWCFGVEEPGCYGALDLKTEASILFVPRLPAEYAVWEGKLYTLEEFRQRYAVDEVYYTDEIAKIFKSKQAALLLTLSGQNSDSGLQTKEAIFDGINEFKVNNTILYPEMCECRVIKSPQEIEVLEYVIKISSDAHKSIMRMIKPGVAEFQMEAAFMHYVYSVGGCRHVSYTCICGSGHNASILHYGHAGAPNNKIINDGDMCLFDMGGNYCGYAADITCSFPVNGKFTEDQKMIYNAVLAARNAVMNAAKPNVAWTDMHLLANKTMLTSLKTGSLLVGEVDEMIKVGLHEVFQPHGLGHLMGLDVHDVGGYLPGHPERSSAPGLRKLRTSRVLQPGMVLTIEPGCYFIDCLLDAALKDPKQSKFIIAEKLKKFRGWGGVRIEDDVLITETGVRNLTDVPRTVEEIEKWMAARKEENSPQTRKFNNENICMMYTSV